MNSANIDTTVNWKKELNATAFKYHLLIARVGLALNIVFAVGDYFNSAQHFYDFLIFRIVVSLLTLGVVLAKDRFIDNPAIIVLIPVLGISIQNAYMYSVLEGAEFQKHTFAYIALYIAAGMFILWEPIYSFLVVVTSLIVNVVLFLINSPLEVSEILINGGLLTLMVASLSILQISSRRNLIKKEIIARLALAESNQQLAVKNVIIEEKNKDISDSINYALNIQRAILPPIEKIDKSLKDYFILYKPKDVISGDFYWFDSLLTTPRNNQPAQEVAAIAAVDCTGHGVPGALMSVIGSTVLNQTMNRASANNAGEALTLFNKKISENLNSIKDGMDMALCIINFEKAELQYAGANNPIFIVKQTITKPEDELLTEIRADKQAIGADVIGTKRFTNKIIQLEKGDTIYMFTDGYADQFGGPSGKKFKYGKFKEVLLNIRQKPMAEQKDILQQEFDSWKGNLEQVDDVLVIGIKI
jgi:sigma-B regulation protein RsbU (phosphoserine phosphatase)